jgi:hypothetical protein
MERKPIRSALKGLEIGEKILFPRSRRKSVRTTASDLKSDDGIVFETEVKGDWIIVERIDINANGTNTAI